MKNPHAEVERFWKHNEQYGWRVYNTPEKRIRAAQDWVPETQGKRVSDRFLEAWRGIYATLRIDEIELREAMLHEGSRVSANNGCMVVHALKSVQELIVSRGQQRIIDVLAQGNPVRYTWP